ncbi:MULTISPECIES: hypothetical protein [unclassified Bradyrhizobium]|uniref:hypothetical protein n=1 Tax=unclassified Bradyrhizobium TaxID=2631580 RepID=UPI0028E2E48E|nr:MULTISPECIES: hypothetical protein [unclassified Bradyrhizobium]
MTKRILVSLAILTLAASAASAAPRNHHQRAMNAYARVDGPPVSAPAGVSNDDRALYFQNLRDSGYNPRNDYNANGTIKTQ